MPTQIALLRAINVGGRNKVAMSDLRDLLGSIGFVGAKSLLQSGNLIFQGDRRTATALESLLEAETERRLGVSVEYIIRSAVEWEAMIARNPFPDAAQRDPSHLVVLFLKSAPAAKHVKALQDAIKGPEIICSRKKELYVVYTEGIGRSKLTNTLVEQKLGVRATGRNWNTILKLAALAKE